MVFAFVIAGLTGNLSCKIGFRKRFRIKCGMTLNQVQGRLEITDSRHNPNVNIGVPVFQSCRKKDLNG